jgi:phosphotransferase system HPr-like phosphotransfer protein
MLAAECGCTLTVRTDGADEEAAAAAIVELIADGFGEM